MRLAARHPNIEIVALTANTHAGKPMAEVFPHFFMLDLPKLVEWEKVDWTSLDAAFCGLPHGTTQEITAAVLAKNPKVKVIDMSADFRLHDMKTYAEWYGHEHRAPKLQAEAVYGLTEVYREQIKSARLSPVGLLSDGGAACACADRSQAGMIDADDIVIDAKSGVSARVRTEAEHALHRGRRGAVALSVAKHRHAPEIEQEIGRGRVAGDGEFHDAPDPMSRGELCTSMSDSMGASADDLRAALEQVYRGEPFVHVARKAYCRRRRTCAARTSADWSFADRIKAARSSSRCLDNLVKGSAGQAFRT